MQQEVYTVLPIQQVKEKIMVEVPGSKSITNRALLLSALSNGTCKLKGVLFSDDSRHFLQCLSSLGFSVEINETEKTVLVRGENGQIPKKQATIDVGSAGTAARFLTAMLALSEGDYLLNSSEQMKRRPMSPLLSALQKTGVSIDYIEKEGYFPFQLHSKGLISKQIAVDVGLSSQFLSALLMAGVLSKEGLEIILTGKKIAPSYIQMTIQMMEQFGVTVNQLSDTQYFVPENSTYQAMEYQIEPDVSGACYFYAMAALLGNTVLVKNIHFSSMQGDLKFLEALKQLGCQVRDTKLGIEVTGAKNGVYSGIEIDMNDFSDQTMTLAVLAAFATSPSKIHHIEHIRYQESNRMAAIIAELNRIGVRCEEQGTGIIIYPTKLEEIKPAIIETYEDHRMAMAFSLIGLKVNGIQIANPACCAKTFENYFEIIDTICQK